MPQTCLKAQPPNSSPVSTGDERIPWLVVGMGSMAYGKERRAVTTLKHIPKIKPHFFTSQWESGNIEDFLRENGFGLTRTYFGHLGLKHFNWTLQNFCRMPQLFWTVMRTYRKEQARGILILELRSFINALPAILLLKWFAGARLVFYLGDIPHETAANKIACRIMARVADSIIVNSQAVQRGTAKLGVSENRMVVVYNGKDLERCEAAEPLPFRAQYGWPDDSLLIGYAGQFAVNKGVWDFVHAAEKVLQEARNCRFVMIGKRDDQNTCYRELADYIREKKLDDVLAFPGWVQQMESAYAALDVMVVPSRHDEPAANVIIEAMARGVPVIATRVGGSPELVGGGETGFLVARENAAEIAACVLTLNQSRNLRQTMGAAARRRAESHFDICKNALQVQKFLLPKR